LVGDVYMKGLLLGVGDCSHGLCFGSFLCLASAGMGMRVKFED
jgi:hypothetical protein